MVSKKRGTVAAGELSFSFTTEIEGDILRCVITSPDPRMRYAVYVYDCEKDDHPVPLLKDPYAESTVRTYDLRKAGGDRIPAAVRVKVFARKNGQGRAILGERLRCASAVRDTEELPFSFTTEIEGDILRCVITSPDPRMRYAVYVYDCGEDDYLVPLFKDPYAESTVRTYDLRKAGGDWLPTAVRVKVFAQKDGKKWAILGERLRCASVLWDDGELPFSFTTELDGRVLRCDIRSPDPETRYMVRLYARDGKRKALLIEDADFSGDIVQRTYDLTEGLSAYDHSVDLFVRVFARKEGRQRFQDGGPIPVVIAPSDPQILRPERPEDLPDQLPFSRWEEPFMDFCLVYGWPEADIAGSGSMGIGEWHTSLFSRSPDGEDVPCWMISSRRMAETPTCRLLFSGMGRSDTMFLLGQDDAAAVPDPRSLRDTIGNFTMVYQDADQIYIGSDYFGVGQLFYYEDPDGRFAVSDRYHLLLLVLKRLGAPLRIDHEKWMADLWRYDVPFVQIWSRDMEIEGTHVLPVGRCVRIGRDGWEILPSEIDEVLRDPGEFRPEEYRDLLDQAGAEIMDNIRVVYRNPKVRRVDIDVTGGLDTRTVVAAWSRLDAADRHGIPSHMFTHEKPMLPEDAYVGVEIGRRAGLFFAVDPVVLVPQDVVRNELALMSRCFLTYVNHFTYMHYVPPFWEKETSSLVRFSGSYGEACTRISYFKHRYYRLGDYPSISELLDDLSNSSTYKIWSPSFRAAWRRSMERELRLLPGRTPCEKFDMHFLNYYNGTHCGTTAATMKDPRWGPIQSKTLFRLKRQTFHLFPQIKLPVNLIESLSPEIADVRLGVSGDVLAQEALREKGELLTGGYGRLPELDRETIDKILAMFYEAQWRSMCRTGTKEEQDACQKKDRDFEKRELEWVRYALFPVLDVIDGDLGPEERRSVEQYVKEQIIDVDIKNWPDRRGRRDFINRVLHMYWLTRLLDA